MERGNGNKRFSLALTINPKSAIKGKTQRIGVRSGGDVASSVSVNPFMKGREGQNEKGRSSRLI